VNWNITAANRSYSNTHKTHKTQKPQEYTGTKNWVNSKIDTGYEKVKN